MSRFPKGYIQVVFPLHPGDQIEWTIICIHIYIYNIYIYEYTVYVSLPGGKSQFSLPFDPSAASASGTSWPNHGTPIR